MLRPARCLALTLTLMAACSAQATERNPFRPNPAPVKPAARLLPPIPVPPVPARLPPVELPPPLETAAEPPVASPGAVPKKPRSFLSRNQIEASRALCRVELSGPTSFRLPATRGTFVVPYKGAQECITAVSAEDAWVEFRTSKRGSLEVTVSANPDTLPRDTHLTVVAPNNTFELSIHQEALPAPTGPASTEKSE